MCLKEAGSRELSFRTIGTVDLQRSIPLAQQHTRIIYFCNLQKTPQPLGVETTQPNPDALSDPNGVATMAKKIEMSKPRNYVALAVIGRGGSGAHGASKKAQRAKANRDLKREVRSIGAF